MTNAMTPKALAAELDVDPKRLRAYLRQNHARRADAKNTAWQLDEATIEAARERFAPKAD